MLSPPKRNWLASPRLDSRLLLKCLIAFNIVLAVYNILTLQTTSRNSKSSPCVVVINTSKGGREVPAALKEETLLKSLEKGTLNEDATSSIELTKQTNHNTEKWQKSEVQKRWWTTEVRGSYSVIRNYVIADERPNFNESVTLSTQGTFEFLHHVERLCQRWDGPVSVAVYAPGDDFTFVINVIYYLRRCKDPCIMRNVSWHMVYDSSFGPRLDNISFPETFLNEIDCSKSIENITNKLNKAFRKDHSLPYPINVVRNVARLSAPTHYLLASDIELYPSINIVSSFFKLLHKEKSGLISFLNVNTPHVYVLPIFEVNSGIKPPFTKAQLQDLAKSGNAIFFHKWVCDACQNFPDRDKWIHSPIKNDSLDIFTVTKRLRNRNAWEPLYIGTNKEPLYDERLTWDGKRDKMSQMYEMCLMNYDLAILDNAFLVHAPGIKHIDPKDQKKRLPFIKRNNKVYNMIISKLRKEYGSKNNC